MSWSSLPPPPEQLSGSKPIWKRWWLWVIVAVIILISAGAGIAQIGQTETEADAPSPVASPTVASPTAASPIPETAQVPNVEGRSVDIATSELEAAGFVVNVETKLTNAVHPGTVLQQAATAGSVVEVGDTIVLTVAEALPKVPKVVGKTLANAKRALMDAGFEVGKVTQQTSGKRKGTVISQLPAGGTSARPGRTVSLVTAKPAPQQSTNCTPGYSPCLPPAPDYDCLGGSGDGPAYTGFVRVTGSDPYGLDSDNDGFGCE